MKRQDVWKYLPILLVSVALIAGCADGQMMDKMKGAMKGAKDKMMGKKKMMKGDEAAVKARRKLMRGIGADMKRLKTAIKQGSGWVVQEQVRQAAGDMYKKASQDQKGVSEEHTGGQDDLDRRDLAGQGEVQSHRGRPGRERRRAGANPLQGRACGHQEGGGTHRQAVRRMPQIVPQEEEKITTQKIIQGSPGARRRGFLVCERGDGLLTCRDWPPRPVLHEAVRF